jgi:hypothetical protein
MRAMRRAAAAAGENEREKRPLCSKTHVRDAALSNDSE